MSVAIENKRVDSITVGELKLLIGNTIFEIIDSDFGLELNYDVVEELRKSLDSKDRIPAEKVAEELGLKMMVCDF